MNNRRHVLFSLAGAFTAVSLVGVAKAVPATLPSEAPPDTPQGTVIPGHPPILDFGEGVRVRCNKDAFLTLWEGPRYWLTFGVGRAHYAEQAQGQAVKYAKAAMKLLLMTEAFLPERLERVEGGGWRLKSRNIRDFVRGDIELPGNPFWPNNDAFMGFGDTDAQALGSLGFGALTAGGITGGQDLLTGSWHYVDAFSAYVVFKREVSLDWVRRNAQIVPAG